MVVMHGALLTAARSAARRLLATRAATGTATAAAMAAATAAAGASATGGLAAACLAATCLAAAGLAATAARAAAPIAAASATPPSRRRVGQHQAHCQQHRYRKQSSPHRMVSFVTQGSTLPGPTRPLWVGPTRPCTIIRSRRADRLVQVFFQTKREPAMHVPVTRRQGGRVVAETDCGGRLMPSAVGERPPGLPSVELGGGADQSD